MANGATQANPPSNPDWGRSWNSLQPVNLLQSGAPPRVPPAPAAFPAFSSGNAGGLIVPPAVQRSAYGTQSGQPATDVGVCPEGLPLEWNGLSLSARGPTPQVFDPQSRHLGGTRTLDLRNDGESTAAEGGAVGAGAQARRVGQRQVRPCLSVSRSTVSDHPGVARSQTTAPVSIPTPFIIHRSAARGQAAPVGQANPSMSPSMVSRRLRAVRDQTTVPISPSTFVGGLGATRGHAMASMSPSTVSARPGAARGQTTAPISPFTVARRSSAVPYRASGEIPLGSFAPVVRPRMLAISAPHSATTSGVLAGNHRHPSSSLSSVSGRR